MGGVPRPAVGHGDADAQGLGEGLAQPADLLELPGPHRVVAGQEHQVTAGALDLSQVQRQLQRAAAQGHELELPAGKEGVHGQHQLGGVLPHQSLGGALCGQVAQQLPLAQYRQGGAHCSPVPQGEAHKEVALLLLAGDLQLGELLLAGVQEGGVAEQRPAGGGGEGKAREEHHIRFLLGHLLQQLLDLIAAELGIGGVSPVDPASNTENGIHGCKTSF